MNNQDTETNIFQHHYSARSDQGRESCLVTYRLTKTPVQHQCRDCGSDNAFQFNVEIVSVTDDAGGPLDPEQGYAAVAVWQITAGHYRGLPICDTPACLNKTKLNCSISAAH